MYRTTRLEIDTKTIDTPQEILCRGRKSNHHRTLQFFLVLLPLEMKRNGLNCKVINR